MNDKNNNNYSKNEKYPRVEKHFKNSLKLILKYDEFLKNIEKISKSILINL